MFLRLTTVFTCEKNGFLHTEKRPVPAEYGTCQVLSAMRFFSLSFLLLSCTVFVAKKALMLSTPLAKFVKYLPKLSSGLQTYQFQVTLILPPNLERGPLGGGWGGGYKLFQPYLFTPPVVL